ncbi:hypothetical protein ACJX0J_036114, partial [Zea mays]
AAGKLTRHHCARRRDTRVRRHVIPTFPPVQPLHAPTHTPHSLPRSRSPRCLAPLEIPSCHSPPHRRRQCAMPPSKVDEGDYDEAEPGRHDGGEPVPVRPRHPHPTPSLSLRYESASPHLHNVAAMPSLEEFGDEEPTSGSSLAPVGSYFCVYYYYGWIRLGYIERLIKLMMKVGSSLPVEANHFSDELEPKLEDMNKAFGFRAKLCKHAFHFPVGSNCPGRQVPTFGVFSLPFSLLNPPSPRPPWTGECALAH